jgi:hypothetical protein
MRTQPFLLGLTVVNLLLLLFLLLSGAEPASAISQASVLRGSALEIVDGNGRVRASIKVQPAETFEATGRKYPETVMLRLIDPSGRPEVKMGASVEGGGLSFVGETDAAQILLRAEGNGSSLRLTNKGGAETVIAP